MKITLEAYQTK